MHFHNIDDSLKYFKIKPDTIPKDLNVIYTVNIKPLLQFIIYGYNNGLTLIIQSQSSDKLYRTLRDRYPLSFRLKICKFGYFSQVEV